MYNKPPQGFGIWKQFVDPLEKLEEDLRIYVPIGLGASSIILSMVGVIVPEVVCANIENKNILYFDRFYL